MGARTLALVVAFVLPVASQAAAGPFEDGQAAAQRGDYAATLNYWKTGADAGDARAQYGVGAIYGEGRGVPQDYGEAAKWYRLAVAQGYGPAQINLGVLLETGQGVARDEREAVRLYRLAAEKGISAAQVNLGRMYSEGLGGLPQDFEEAVKWLAVASAQGSEEGQTSLGKIHDDGVKAYDRGDYATALKMWFPLAQHGHPASRFKLGTMYEKGEGVFRNITQAADWYRMAAEQGDTTSQFNIGVLHMRGDGAPQNNVQAFKWMTLASSGKTDLRIPEAAARALRNLAARMTQDQIARAQSLARMWRPQPALAIRSSNP